MSAQQGYGEALRVATEVALDAGARLQAEFHRAGGPRGEGGHAEVDLEVEEVIRQRLLAAFPRYGYRGEETRPNVPPGEDGHVWLVDPNDGTRDFVMGRRGSAVSLGLVRQGRPVLGVVYAPCAPDDDGDLVAWAEGCGPITRNGRAVQRAPWLAALGSLDCVLTSFAADRRIPLYLRAVAPARIRPLPSIAYRLALAAVGEGSAVTTLQSPHDWDYAGGHALVLAAGGVMLDRDGAPVAYGPDGASSARYCLAGGPTIAATLAIREWDWVRASPREPYEPGLEVPFERVDLVPGRALRDPATLARAQGCLLGQVAGDSLGSLVEFQSAGSIRCQYPDGPRLLRDGGTWDLIAGQPTDDSELALLLARCLVRDGAYHPEAALAAYRAWYRSHPFDVGSTTIKALGYGQPDQASQSNGSLMRISPLGVWGHRLAPDETAELARQDSRLTHPHPACQEACAAFTVAIAYAVASGAAPDQVYDYTLAWAERSARHPDALGWLRDAATTRPDCFSGWVRNAFQNAFWQLLHAPNLEEGVVGTVREGGDTDTNAAIAGALLGAVHGREAVPVQWRTAVLSCRPHPEFRAAHHPRPRVFWPTDLLEIAERLALGG